MMIKILTVGVIVALSACSSDWVPFSGGALSGTSTSSPADWRTVAVTEVIQLETQPADPYSVKLWVVEAQGNLYVFAGASYSTWVEHIDANPNVRLEADGSIYELRAERVTDAAEFQVFAERWEAKYGRRPRNENVDETYLLRLVPRG